MRNKKQSGIRWRLQPNRSQSRGTLAYKTEYEENACLVYENRSIQLPP